MRPLIIDDVAKAEAERVLRHAAENHYFPGQATPGDDPRFVAHFGTYRAVFSFRHADGLVYRHLSVSVPGELYPNPIAFFMIAELFGFTGWSIDMGARMPEGWVGKVDSEDHCVVLAQPIASDVPKEARQ